MFRRLQNISDRWVVRKAVGHCDESGLIRAIETGNVHILELMLQLGVTANATDSRGTPAIHFAAADGNLKALRLLVEQGANLNSVDGSGRTALMRATEKGHFLLVEYLLDAGAEISLKDQAGEDVLFKAVNARHGALVQRLLQMGADPNTTNLGGMPALVLACKQNYPGMVKSLLAFGADPNLTDTSGKAPMDMEGLPPRIEDLLFEAGGRPTERIRFTQSSSKKARYPDAADQRNPWFVLADMALQTMDWMGNPADTAKAPWVLAEERGKEWLSGLDIQPLVTQLTTLDQSLGIRENLSWLLAILTELRDVSELMRARIDLPDGNLTGASDRVKVELLESVREFAAYLRTQVPDQPVMLAVDRVYGDGPFRLGKWLAPAGQRLSEGAVAAEIALPSGLKIKLRAPKSGWLVQLLPENASIKGETPVGLLASAPPEPPAAEAIPEVDAELLPMEEDEGPYFHSPEPKDIPPSPANA